MEFRHNEVLGFGKFLGGVQRLIFFFLRKSSFGVVFFAKSQVPRTHQLRRGRWGWDRVASCGRKYTCAHI
jgi:hypothetical protein